jgi:hypothetical protein
MILSQKQFELREAITQWLNTRNRDAAAGLALLTESGYKPHVSERLRNWGPGDSRTVRALGIELHNCIQHIHKQAKASEAEANVPLPAAQHPAEQSVGNIEKELQKQYPGIIKKTLAEFHSLYQSRSILHRELKAAGEANNDKTTRNRKRLLTVIDAISRRMDILWGIVDRYKQDGELPDESFFEEPFDPEKEATEGQPIPGYTDFVLPDNMEELKKMKENLRIKILKAENRLQYQSEKTEDKPNPMPEGPKRAELIKRLEKMKKQKETVEYRIAELK